MGLEKTDFVFLAIILSLAVAGIVLWRRQHGFRFYRKHYLATGKLRESEERFRAIFDNSNDGIIVIEKNTRKFLFGNRTIHQMLGYTTEELMGMGIEDIHPEKDFPAILEMFKKLVSNDIQLAPNVPVKRKDGSVFYADINTHNLNLGGKTYQVGVFRNVTERKQAADEIEKINAALEEKVALRTSQFLNVNLELSKEIALQEKYEKQLKTSLLEKELLLKEVNHRVKNNLQTIASILGLQIMQSQNEEIISRLKEVQERVNSMALLQGMLHQAENLNEINFEEYINALVANLSHSLVVRPADLEITINAPGILLDINTAIPCGLIINELLTNSLRHAFRDKKERKIWLDFNFDRRKDSYVISVRDNGIGLPENFDLQKATTLGMQLVEGLTKQLNGTVVLQNNGGSQFTITFPNPKKEATFNE